MAFFMAQLFVTAHFEKIFNNSIGHLDREIQIQYSCPLIIQNVRDRGRVGLPNRSDYQKLLYRNVYWIEIRNEYNVLHSMY